MAGANNAASSGMANITIVLLVVSVACAFLQVFLSKREQKLPGLILPALAFLLSFIFPLSMAVPPDGATAGFVFQLLGVWLLGNIPTAVYLAIYFVCRGKYRRRQQIEKMNIQDLN